ncbi:DNA/RNA non-specific endonuclease [Sorangium sp. So ce321]|uniref:DNA/RNA non-specific endonuclease n=1 Tax=Sorangium sp. So ce321 TaxID=3133300 RepID=UPI003F63B89D
MNDRRHPPHPATVKPAPVAQPSLAASAPPHAATVPTARAAQPSMRAALPPHAATVHRQSGGAEHAPTKVVQRMEIESSVPFVPSKQREGTQSEHWYMTAVPVLPQRPWWAGPVTIHSGRAEDFLRGNPIPKGRNARQVHGYVVPCSTWGRLDAPSPNSGFETGKKLGTDKGHLMALQLGGPDVSENIVPQPSNWQASGCWRKLEKGIHDLAVAMMNKYLKQPIFPLSTEKLAALSLDWEAIPAPAFHVEFSVTASSSVDLSTQAPDYYNVNVGVSMANHEGYPLPGSLAAWSAEIESDKPVKWGTVSVNDRIFGYAEQKKMIREAFEEHLRY